MCQGQVLLSSISFSTTFTHPANDNRAETASSSSRTPFPCAMFVSNISFSMSKLSFSTSKSTKLCDLARLPLLQKPEGLAAPASASSCTFSSFFWPRIFLFQNHFSGQWSQTHSA